MSVKPQWNAALYDDKHSFVWKLAAGVLELLEPKPGERILDLGCGTGHLTAKIAEAGSCVVGVDRSPEMIDQARGRYPALRFEVMDARELSFNEAFDAVFSNATLHWIHEPELVIRGIAKLLGLGGRFVAELGGKGNTGELIKALEEHSGGFYSPSPGMVYPALTWLEEMGYASVTAEGARRLYSITESGRQYLGENQEAADTMLRQLDYIGRRMGRVREIFGGPVEEDDAGTQALGAARRDLSAALREKRGASTAEEDRIAQILREAAARIRAPA